MCADGRMVVVGGALAMALQTVADPVGLGWHERGGVFVDGGSTATQDGNIVLEQNAKFYKSGAGQLNLPLSKVNAQKPYSMTVLGGTLALEAGGGRDVRCRDTSGGVPEGGVLDQYRLHRRHRREPRRKVVRRARDGY